MTNRMSDDRPYEILQNTERTGIVEVPVELIADDYVFYSYGTSTPFFRMGDSQVLEVYEGEFNRAYEEGTLFQLTMHSLITGHRSRLEGLDRLLEHIRSKPGVWFATHAQVAEVAKEQMR